MPILSRTLGSVLTANCLRNSDTWPDIETYLSEYQCIANQADLFRLTGVRVPFGGDADHPMPLVRVYLLHVGLARTVPGVQFSHCSSCIHEVVRSSVFPARIAVPSRPHEQNESNLLAAEPDHPLSAYRPPRNPGLSFSLALGNTTGLN